MEQQIAASPSSELTGCIEIRRKTVRDDELRLPYELAYRKKWKDLQEQLEQDLKDEEEHFQKKISGEKDQEKSGEERFEKRRKDLQQKLTQMQERCEQLKKETEVLQSQTLKILPGKGNDAKESLKMVFCMLTETQKELHVRQGRSVECTVCHCQLRDEVLLPCRHFVLCHECSSKVKACPICRTEVLERVRVVSC